MSTPERQRHPEGEPKGPEGEKTPEAEKKESVMAELGYESKDLTPERLKEVREAADRSRRESEQTIEDRFEKPSKPDQKLLFHNRRHSQGVAERAGKIAELLVPQDDPTKTENPEQFAAAVERLKLAAETAALDHDRVNTSIIIEVPDAPFGGPPFLRADGTPFTKKSRKRFLAPAELTKRDDLRSKKIQAESLGGKPLTPEESELLEKFETVGPLGTNEADSAKETQQKLRSERAADGSPLFTASETGDIETFKATVPGWDGKNGTVAQIHLSEKTSLVDRAVALADLGEAGLDPEGYDRAGDALLLEDWPDIAEVLTEPEKFDEETQRRIADRAVGFAKGQIGFAKGRKARLHGYETPIDPKDESKGTKTVSDLDGLPAETQQRIREYFDKFDDTIAVAAETAARREKLFADPNKPFAQAFAELRKEMLGNVEKYSEPLGKAE